MVTLPLTATVESRVLMAPKLARLSDPTVSERLEGEESRTV